MDPQRYIRARRMAKRAGPTPDPHPEDGPRDPGELQHFDVEPGPVFDEVDLMCSNCDYEVTRLSTSGFYDDVCPRCGSDMFDMNIPDTDPPDIDDPGDHNAP